MSSNKLTDAKIKALKEKGKHSDGGGLFIQVTQTGSKLWRLKYRFGGREKIFSLGVYPHITLAKARAMRDIAKNQLANGIDPSAHKKELESMTTLRPPVWLIKGYRYDNNGSHQPPLQGWAISCLATR